MNVRSILKFMAAGAAAVFVPALLSFSASAEEIESITVLGDSISSGYGLNEGERSYASYLGEYFGAEVENFAADGKTTSQLLELLEGDDAVSESVGKSDLICVSIGGNDVMDVFFDDLIGIAGGFSAPSAEGSFGFSPESIQELILSFSSSLGPAAAEAGENIRKIAARIEEINPKARLIFQTIYNPFETDNENMKPVYSPIYTFTSIYLGTINSSIRNSTGLEYADIQNKFKGGCTLYTNINNMDIHPNKIGHLLIAEEIVQQLKLSGENEIFIREFEKMISDDVISEDLRREIENLSEGKFREQAAGDAFSQQNINKEEVTEYWTEAETGETDISKQSNTEKSDELVKVINTSQGKYKSILVSTVGLIAMIAIITAAVLIKRKNKYNKQK